MINQFLKSHFAVGLTSASMLVLASSAVISSKASASSSPSGSWIGTAHVNEHNVPLRLELSPSANGIRGTLINGNERSASSSGSYSDGHLVLHFDYYANTLNATLKDGTLTGTFSGRGRSVPVTAQLNGKPIASDSNAPRIAGIWDVAVENGTKGEHTWKVRISQNGSNVIAVIERIDGDTGKLYGTWQDGLFEVTPAPALPCCGRSPTVALGWRPQPTAAAYSLSQLIAVRLLCESLRRPPMTLFITHI